MKRKSRYTTRQGEAVLEYVASLGAGHATAEQIAGHFAGSGINAGLSTIYRQLDKLTREGKLRRFTVDGVTSACYQYAADCGSGHFHLKCDGCGELIHLECELLAELSQHVCEDHGFEINPLKTVFYGRCPHCKAPDTPNG